MLESLKRSARPVTALVGVLLLNAVAGVAAVTIDGESGEKKVKKVHVKKIVHEVCEGDCEASEQAVRQIFIGEDGEVKELEGDDHVWVSADDTKVHVVKMGGHGHHSQHAQHAMFGKGGFLGVQLTELTAELREHFGVPSDAGVMVSKVLDDTPAAKAGIQVGDIVSGVDGETVSSAGELAHRIRGFEDGATAVLEVWRAGKVETMSAAIEVREAPQMMAGMPGTHKIHRIKVMCDDGEDCDVDIDQGFDIGDFDCGGASECKVQVKCEDSGCECTVNGEASDCQEIPGFAELHGE